MNAVTNGNGSMSAKRQAASKGKSKTAGKAKGSGEITPEDVIEGFTQDERKALSESLFLLSDAPK